jgi:DNA (cytosine-5)-methyltransferase 1
MKPRALDLFCCAGGATKGLQMAGFHVTGVDIRPQPRYCGDAFHQADALTFPLDGFDFIWASPPCQRYSLGSLRWDPSKFPDLIEPMRQRMATCGAVGSIENVTRAPLRRDLMLCGTMFGLKVVRHRAFECFGFRPHQPDHKCAPRGCTKRKEYVTVAGHGGFGSNALPVWKRAMDIDWMSKAELAEAIPPAYSEFIGRQAMQILERAA